MYQRERARVMTIRENRHSFAQLLGEHAVRLCELAQADSQDSKRGLMQTWVEIHKINDEWASLVTRGESEQSEFAQVTRKLIQLYSEALGDYILDKASGPDWRKKISKLVETEGKFFGALSACSRHTKDEWIAYTGSVIEMVDTLVRYGHESEGYENVAGNCVRKGVLLGAALDFSLRT